MSDFLNAMIIIILAIIGFVVYGLPSIIAYRKHHPKENAIIIINFFLGWTIIGWVICLAWAVQDN